MKGIIDMAQIKKQGKQLAWFVAIWALSVGALTIVGGIIRWALMG